MLNIEITKTASKQKKKLIQKDFKLQDKLNKAINELPDGDIKKLQGEAKEYRLRVGEYRVLFSKENNNIIIHAIVNRKNAY